MKYHLIGAVVFAAIAGPALAQSAEDGEAVFKKCKACHQVGADAKNKTGPILTGIVGRAAGSIEDFKYSKSMLAAAETGLVWNEDSIFEYLLDPTKYLRALLDDPKARAKMTFKLKDEDDRRAVIAYLGTFQAASATPENGFCVVNASPETHLFVTETREGTRQMAELEPGASLCAQDTDASDGIVSVFENVDSLEGCSRIIPVGVSETMLEYAEFDRCGWGSRDS